MATIDTFRRLADSCRAIPAKFGLREHAVWVVIKHWSGDERGIGTCAETVVPILVGGENVKVRAPNQRELALGNLSAGAIVIGPFTPEFAEGHGINREIFSGKELGVTDEWVYRVVGPQYPDGAEFRQKNTNADRAIRITATAEPIGNLA